MVALSAPGITPATVLTPARALRQPRRFDLRAGIGAVVLVAAAAGNVGFWLVSSDSNPVLVAARDLPAGAQLTPADLAIAHVRVDDSIYQALVPAGERTGVVGKVLAEPLHARQFLGRAHVSDQPALAPGQLAMTIPVSAETVAGGRIRPGTHVQVLVTTNKGRPESRTQVVLPRVAVYDVGRDGRASVVNTSATGTTAAEAAPTSLTVVVTQDEALALGHARLNGDLHVALLPPPSADQPR